MGRGWVVASFLVAVSSLAIAGWALEEARAAREEARRSSDRAMASIAVLTESDGRNGARPRTALPGPAPAAPGARSGAAPGDPEAPAPGGSTAGEGVPTSVLPPAGSPGRKAAEEGLRAFVRQAVHEELEARRKEGVEPAAGEKKPPLSQFAAQLELDDSQREVVHRAVVGGQEEVIALLRTATAGGRVPLDDIVKAFTEKPEESRARLMEVFGMLATEKVPGNTETYAQRMDAVKKATVDTFRRSFTPEQFKAYERTGQDPLEIQVEDSPWIEVLKDSWSRRR